MINFNSFTNENKTEHNPKWPYIPHNSYKILKIGDFGSGQSNALLNLINNQTDIDKKHFYGKDPCEEKISILN